MIERMKPVQRRQPRAEIALDAGYAVVRLTMLDVFRPLAGIVGTSIVNALGAGMIELRAHGAWAPVSFLAYILVLDFLEYAVHRAQHRVKPLWAMHSLHHSEQAMNVLTGYRHFWLEPLLKTALVYPVAGILFKVPPEIATFAAVVYFIVNASAHLNLRISIGRFSLLVMNPQYHRIHHSVRPEHLNKNFADVFPLFDVIFGTAWKPAIGEYPETGLDTGEKPASVWEAASWPLQRRQAVNRIPLALK
jgi:sterol desaturase/sphingolipid hydroxylase (fatty acid hydroxylase superfamily)